jgi:hypothetical protein
MRFAEPLGDENVQRLTERLLARPPEDRRRAVVVQDDALVVVDGDDRVGGDRDDALELCALPPPRRLRTSFAR